MSLTQIHYQDTVKELEKLFNQGLTLSENTLDYLDSAHGLTSPSDLARCLEEEDQSELASLLELLFFPDRKVKVRLEPLLEAARFSERDEDEILERLLSRCRLATLYFPGSPKAIPAPLNRETARGFIKRLRIHRNPPPELLETLASRATRQEALSIQVLLRSSRFAFTPGRVRFLQIFFQAFSPRFARFEERLRLAASFLEEVAEDTAIGPALVQKKIALELALDKARSLEERLRTQPMEALLMQKESIPSFNLDQLLDQLQGIDDLCAAYLGYIPETGLEGASVSYARQPGAGSGKPPD